MSFLKDLKEDLSMAVNELVDDGAKTVAGTEDVKETAGQDVAVETVENVEAEIDLAVVNEVANDVESVEIVDEAEEEVSDVEQESAEELIEEVKEEIKMDNIFEEKTEEVVATDEVTEITAGTTIRGDIETSGSINVYGKVVGNIKCLGKVSVTGTIVGTTEASEVFANNARIEGDIVSAGCVKVGNGSVIIGSVGATSAVIGGAIKGDIDVHGPVIVDATAVVKGDIMSRSVQINNGAVIDGRCSQCYADIDYESLFDDTFSK